jgi:hypothetical protein
VRDPVLLRIASHVRAHESPICTALETAIDTSFECALVASQHTDRGASELSAFGATNHGSNLAPIDVTSCAALEFSHDAAFGATFVCSDQPAVGRSFETAFDAAKCETQFCSCIAPHVIAHDPPICTAVDTTLDTKTRIKVYCNILRVMPICFY